MWAHNDGRGVLRRFDRDGVAQSGEVLVGVTPSSLPSDERAKLSVATKDDGALVVVWPGSGGGVYGQRFAPGVVAGEALPEAPALAVSVAPVPSGPSGATVRYVLSAEGPIRVSVVDVLGREVAVVLDGQAPAGEQTVRVNTFGMPAGVYIVRAEAGGRVASARLVVAR